MTADQRVPPMGGVAVMAMYLAEKRAGPDWHGFLTGTDPCVLSCREVTERDPIASPVSFGYYQIIDRIARGEKP